VISNYYKPKFGAIIYHAALFKGLQVVDNYCSSEWIFSLLKARYIKDLKVHFCIFATTLLRLIPAAFDITRLGKYLHQTPV